MGGCKKVFTGTFVITATETSRSERKINTVVAFSLLATSPQGVHLFKPLSHFEQPHHAHLPTRVFNITTESSTTTTQQKSCTHTQRHAANMCVMIHPSLSPRETPNHRADTLTPVFLNTFRSPLLRRTGEGLHCHVSHIGHVDPQCTAPLLALC